jgi:hypothetical protein
MQTNHGYEKINSASVLRCIDTIRLVPPEAGFNLPIPICCAFGIGISQEIYAVF